MTDTTAPALTLTEAIDGIVADWILESDLDAKAVYTDIVTDARVSLAAEDITGLVEAGDMSPETGECYLMVLAADAAAIAADLVGTPTS